MSNLQLRPHMTRKERRRIEEKGERGVCRIQKHCAGNQGYETVGSGIVIKHHIDRRWKTKYLIVTACNVFQGDFNVKNYRVDFVKSTSKLKTFQLNDTVVVGGEISQTPSGLALIPLDSHSSVFRHGLSRKKCGILKHYSFEVESFQDAKTQDRAFSNGLCCHMVADDSTSNLFGVKPHDLARDSTSGQCVLSNCNFNQSTRFPLGAAILRRVGDKWSAAGVLSSCSADGTCRPVWLSQENLSLGNAAAVMDVLEAVLSLDDKEAQTNKDGLPSTDPGGSSMSVSSISPTDAQAKRGKADQSSKDAGGNAVCPIPSVNTEAKESETEESLSDQAIAAPHTADETEQIKRNKKGVSATVSSSTDPATSDKKAEQTKSNKKVVSETDKASHTSLECGKTESNKQGVPVPDEAPHPSLEHRETERNKQGESAPDPSTAPNNTGKTEQIEMNKRDVMTATDPDTAPHNSTTEQAMRNNNKVLPATAPHTSLEHEKTERNKHGESKTLGGTSVKEDKKEWTQVHSAARVSDVTKMKSTLPLGFSVDLRDATGRTPLMYAAFDGKLEVVKGLIERGADPSLEDNRGWNSLHLTSADGNPDIIELLLSNGPDIDSRTAEGFTPLMIAAFKAKLQAVKCLLEKGADPSLQDNRGWNLLHCASQGGDRRIIEVILTRVTDIDSRIATGATPLMIAALSGSLQGVKYLLERGADPSLQDNGGWNVLHCASKGGDPHVIHLILTFVTDIESRAVDGVRPLMIAVFHGTLQGVKYLLEKGADPSLQDNAGMNVLHLASKVGDPRIIHLILTFMTDIESRTVDGVTPLMVAVAYGTLQGIKYLLERGANPSSKDNNGRNSLHYALSRDKGVVELLLSHMTNKSDPDPQNLDETE